MRLKTKKATMAKTTAAENNSGAPIKMATPTALANSRIDIVFFYGVSLD